MTDWDAIFGEAALGLDLARLDAVRADPDSEASTLRSKRTVETLLDPQWDPSAELAATIPGLAPAADGARAPRKRAARRGGRQTPFRRPRPVRDEPLSHARRAEAALSAAAPVTDRDSIFRQEALEFRTSGRGASGGVVRLGAWWIRWSYRLALVLVAASLASLWLIRTDESASGPAVVDGRTGTVAALLPATVGPALARSQGLTVALPSGRSLRVSILHEQLANETAARNAGLALPTQPAILVTGRLTEGTSAHPVAQDARLSAQASVVLRYESLADILGRQFDTMLSQGTAP